MSEFCAALKSRNYWDGTPPVSGVPRADALERIKGFIGNSLTKVIVGQRRCGKSFFLRQIIAGLMADGVNPRNICYLDKERIEFVDLVDHRQLHELIEAYRKRMRVRGKIYLFLDEIQEIAEWERVVNAYSQDSRREYEVFITGSNSHMLSAELGTVLTGRYVPFEIFPFSFQEYAEATGALKDKATLLNYMQHGGLPELLHLDTEETRRHYVASLRDAIILNDVVRRHSIKDPDLLARLFRFVCDNAGNLTSANKIVAFLREKGQKTNFETVANYLSHLRQAMLIHECDRFNLKGKEVLAGNRKYYLNDLAFREYLSSGFESALPRRIENVVYLHFRARGFDVHVGSSRNLEIDFVVEKDGARAYYQVCYLLADETVIEREFRGLEQISDNYPKSVVSLDDVSLGERNGIAHQRVWEIL